GGGKGGRRPCTVAIKCKSCTELRLRQGRGEGVEAGFEIVAEVAGGGAAGAGEVVEGVGHVLAAGGEVGGVGDLVGEVVEGPFERQFRHLVALLPGPEQELGDVGIEPQVAAAERPPQSESAG